MKGVRFIQDNITAFPVLTALILPFLCVSIYELSLYYGHAERFFPFVSDSASGEPEAEYFTFLTVTIAITMAIAGYGRFRQIKYYVETLDSSKVATIDELNRLKKQLHLFNRIALISLYLSCTGAVTTGMFPVSKHLYPHCFGVFLICLMTVGEIFMIIIGVKLYKQFGIESYPRTMLINWAAQFLTGAITLFATLASLYYGGYDNATDGYWRLHWKRTGGGYWPHVLSAVMEWATLNFNNIYMFCFFNRMKNFKNWDKVWAEDYENKVKKS